MKKWRKVCSALLTVFILFMFTACSNNKASNDNKYTYEGKVTQTIQYGKVEGISDDKTSTLAWLGVPYAKPPVGDLRWKAPQNPDKWEGTLETKKYEDKSVQLAGKEIVGSEDCLYLNIWRPNTKDTNLPVLVYAHGGGNITGSGESFLGDVLAKETNSIIISINYRLGAMGWFLNDALKTGDSLDDSGNYGLLDIFKSLEWVKSNIASFGGDAKNVTLSGQSAGGRDVLASLISPKAKDLFQKAMPLSGGMTLSEPEEGKKFAEGIIKKMAIKDGKATNDEDAAKWLASVSKDELAKYLKGKDAKDIVSQYGAVAIKMEQFPHLYKDGTVIPKEGFDVIKSGNYNKVPVLVGSMTNEFTAFAASDSYFKGAVFTGSIASDPNKLKIYNDAINYGSRMYAGFNADAVGDLLTSNKEQPKVYAYRCAWGLGDGVVKNEIKPLAAAHGGDIDLITGVEFMSNYIKGLYTEENKPGRTELSKVMRTYIKNFLKSGDPNGDNQTKWLNYQNGTDNERIMKLDADLTKAKAEMSKEHFVKSEIIEEMNKNLPQQERDELVNNLLKGRFFWEY